MPILAVQYSLKILSSPIINLLFSPLYFRSCGIEPIEQKGKKIFDSPMSVSPHMFTEDLIILLFAILTLSSIIE